MKRIAYALTGLFLTAAVAWGASIPLISGPQDPSQLTAVVNALIQQINSLVTPQTMANYNTPRNLLDNGGMQVYQRGTGTQTCGTTTIPSSAHSADRWGCNVNVTSGAGILQVITTSLPTQPVFNAALLFYRNSGTLAQPQCVMQEIPTTRVTPLQGQGVTLSFYLQGLAAMLAESTTVNSYLFTGTGSDQGLQTFTASPAVTPAWTGIASTQTTAHTVTSSWARYTATYQIPATATEAAIALCWTPTTGGTAGVTDGFRFTGVQLEVGNSASAFEYRSYADELVTAQRFAWTLTEPAADVCQGAGYSTSTTGARIVIANPVTMRAAPIVTSIGATLANTTWKVEDAATPIVLSTPFLATFTANNVSNITLTATTGATQTAGRGVLLCGAGGGGILIASADF